MSAIAQQLRSGSWVTPERIRAICLLLLMVAGAAMVAVVAFSRNGMDFNGRPIGTDFSNVYAAGKLALTGDAATAYDPQRQHAAEQALFGKQTPFYGWHYPPFFFALATLVALLPYGAALAAWLACTFAFYLAIIRAILLQRDVMLIAAAFPAVAVNVGHGQNGFLTAALLGSGLLLLPRRPIAAGIAIGLLAYKPQFGVLIPVALLAAGEWRAILAAGLTVGVLSVAATLVLGVEIWSAFAQSTHFTQDVVLENGGTGWEKIQSLFSALRHWRAPVFVAYTAQALLMLSLAVSLALLWRRNIAYELKAAALVTACLLATPYILDYDLVVLALGIAYFARLALREGFRGGELSVLGFAWLAPLVTRSVAAATTVPLGLLAMLALYGIILRRAMRA